MPKRPQVMLCTDRFQDQALRFQAQGVLASSSGFSNIISQLYAFKFKLYATLCSSEDLRLQRWEVNP